MISTQLGVGPANLEEHAVLADQGPESFMAIEIQARLRSDLVIDVPISYLTKPSIMGDSMRYVEQTHGAILIDFEYDDFFLILIRGFK